MAGRANVALLLLPLLAAGCITGRPAAQLRLGGAQIAVELVESWLRESRERAFYVEQVPPVYLSQHGHENLLKGACDMACTDRRLSARELEAFGDRAVAGRRVAYYGYALYVHGSNPLDAIYAGHMKLVFQRRITDWSELAGAQIPELAGRISLYGPSKSTRAGMVLSPLARVWFAEATWEVLDSDAEIVARVAADPLALGFAGIGYEEGVRYLGLRMERHDKAAYPSLEEIECERYGLAKLIYVYYLDPPAPAVQDALEYLFGDAGRAAIEETDLWPVDPQRSHVTPAAGS
jgi:ABC-type phosphate transport system substrate-binding protein